MEQYLKMEFASCLELALWKARCKRQNGLQPEDSTKKDYKEMCRVRSGASEVIPEVLSFLQFDEYDDATPISGNC